MSQKLPKGDFKWEYNPDCYTNIAERRGCIVDCDLKYTTKAKINTRRFSLAPEHKVVREYDLIDPQLNYLQVENKTFEKQKH